MNFFVAGEPHFYGCHHNAVEWCNEIRDSKVMNHVHID